MLNVRWLGGNPRAICIRTRPRRISCISPRISPICNWDFFHLQFVFLAASHLGFVPIWYLWAQIRQFVLGHSSRGLTVWLLCTNASPPGPPALCNALHCDPLHWWELYKSSMHSATHCTMIQNCSKVQGTAMPSLWSQLHTTCLFTAAILTSRVECSVITYKSVMGKDWSMSWYCILCLYLYLYLYVAIV